MYLRATNKVSEIQLCGKSGVNREKGVQTSSACVINSLLVKDHGYDYVVQCLFQQYFSYIVAVILLMGETEVPEQTHRPVASHCQTERESNSQLPW